MNKEAYARHSDHVIVIEGIASVPGSNIRARFQDPKISSFLVSRRVSLTAPPLGSHRNVGTYQEVANLRILEPGTDDPDDLGTWHR